MTYSSNPRKRGIETTALQRRGDIVAYEKWSKESRDLSEKKYNLDTPIETLFGSNTTCALVPETITGPYYVEGDIIRKGITDGQPGVVSHLDFQFIDIYTCKPIPKLLIDVWHANSTGVYSDLAVEGQGGLNTNFGRGVQESDDDGVVQFDNIFPGHYAGHTNHFHVMSIGDAKVLDDGTYEGGKAQHIGQLYMDESLIKAVEATEPYNTNKQAVTSNSQDPVAAQEATPQ